MMFHFVLVFFLIFFGLFCLVVCLFGVIEAVEFRLGHVTQPRIFWRFDSGLGVVYDAAVSGLCVLGEVSILELLSE